MLLEVPNSTIIYCAISRCKTYGKLSVQRFIFLKCLLQWARYEFLVGVKWRTWAVKNEKKKTKQTIKKIPKILTILVIEHFRLLMLKHRPLL